MGCHSLGLPSLSLSLNFSPSPHSSIAVRTILPRGYPTIRSTTLVKRSFAAGSGEGGGSKLPFGLDKLLKMTDTDDLVATDRDHKVRKNDIPDYVPEDLKKEMADLEIDNKDDLDEMEEENMDDLGLVPPEGSGTFASPILIPSRRQTRQVGFVDPETHDMMWFTIYNDENTYYIKQLGLFFKMLHIEDEEANAVAHH